MDRIDAMRVFVAALDEGSLAGAGRRLRKSPTAVSRAIALLESHVGAELLHRTTRTIRLSEAGERYAAACRRILTDLEEADLLAAGETAAPRGLLTLTGPAFSGRLVLRPIIDDFLDEYPAVRAHLLLLDRHISLVEEGIDVSLRIAHLPESSLIAIRVGQVSRIVCAAPGYLEESYRKGRPRISEPADILQHPCISMTAHGPEHWTFPPHPGSALPQQIRIQPRLTVNTVEAAVGSAVEGRGLTRLFSYQVAEEVQSGKLVVVWRDDERAALPVHLITPEGRLSVPKVRRFFDFAIPRLKADFARLGRL
ncbi:MAG TPA: LysR family transcriptional regulator [Terriglobales bacterium]|nr:LysR family transcriptional regulator [Terriglobales bacterium]